MPRSRRFPGSLILMGEPSGVIRGLSGAAGTTFSYAATSFASSYNIPPLQWPSLPNLVSTGWSGLRPWSEAFAAGEVPVHGGVAYSPVMLYDYASMREHYRPVGGPPGSPATAGATPTPGGIYERDGVMYSVVMLNGSPAFQPVAFGGGRAFGSYQGLSEAENKTLVSAILGRFEGATGNALPFGAATGDAIRFAMEHMTEDAVEARPDAWRALAAVLERPELKSARDAIPEETHRQFGRHLANAKPPTGTTTDTAATSTPSSTSPPTTTGSSSSTSGSGGGDGHEP